MVERHLIRGVPLLSTASGESILYDHVGLEGPAIDLSFCTQSRSQDLRTKYDVMLLSRT